MKIFKALHLASGKRVVVPAVAVFALAFLLIRARRDVGAQPPADVKQAPAAAAAGEKALSQLQTLGAWVNQRTVEDGERLILITFGEAWKGKDSDFSLLDDVVGLGRLNVYIDFDTVSPRGLSELRLRSPINELEFSQPTQRILDELKSLPPCRGLGLRDWEATPAQCRRLATLAADVESLNIFGDANEPVSGIGDAGLAELVGLDKLKSLRIHGGLFTETGLKSLSGMKHLEHLWLDFCPVLEESDLAPLAGLDSLCTLNMPTGVSASALANIAKIGSLETLTVYLADIEPADVEPLARLTHLKRLNLFQFSSRKKPPGSPESAETPQQARRRKVLLADAIGSAVGKIPSLETLHLRLPIGEKGLEGLVAAKNLQSLNVDLAEVNDRILSPVGRMLSLRQLLLVGNGRLSDDGLAHLETLTQLVEIRLPGAGLTDAGLAHLAGLTAIESLEMSGSDVTGVGLAVLRPLVKLKTLRLENSPLCDEGCRALSQLSQLEVLDLGQTKITDAGLESLAALPNLRGLAVYATDVTDKGLAHLAHLKHLESVNVFTSRASPRGIAKLKAAIPGIQISGSGAADRAQFTGFKPGPEDREAPAPE